MAWLNYGLLEEKFFVIILGMVPDGKISCIRRRSLWEKRFCDESEDTFRNSVYSTCVCEKDLIGCYVSYLSCEYNFMYLMFVSPCIIVITED